MHTLELAGVQVPVIGQGTWRMGEDAGQRRAEGVEDVAPGLCHERRRQVFETGVDAKLRQPLHTLGHGK